MRPIDVAAALVFRAGNLLITQRYPDAHLGGRWEFPGGKREAGESLTHDYPEKTVHLRFYICQWLKHEPRPLGCPAFRWVTLSQLGNYQFPAADARLLERLRKDHSLWISGYSDQPG